QNALFNVLHQSAESTVFLRLHSPAQHPARDRTLSQCSAGIDAAVWSETAHRQEVADPTLGVAALRNRYAEKSDAQPRGPTLHRMRPRGRQAAGAERGGAQAGGA